MTTKTLRINWIWFLGLGVLWILLGAIAIGAPSSFAMKIDEFLGGVLVLGGVIQLVNAVRLRAETSFFLSAPAAVVQVGVGLWLALRPGQSVDIVLVSLTLLFAAEALFKGYWAWHARPDENSIWLSVSAVASVAFAVLLATRLFGESRAAIGVLVGLHLIVTGLIVAVIGARGYVPDAVGVESEIEVPVPSMRSAPEERATTEEKVT